MAPKGLSELAKSFRGLHRPGRPLVLANVYDVLSARAVAPLPSCHALATASYAVALAAGTTDDDLTLEQNLAAARLIGRVAAEHDKPLTVDLQDGYGERLEEAVRGAIDAGAVGINLEDYDKENRRFYSPDEAAARVKAAVAVGVKQGLPDFVVNARCDTLVQGGGMAEAVERGRKYLAAGATTVFVWGGGKRGVSKAEVAQLVKAFDGRLNVSLKWTGGLTVAELAEMGVARISVGPTITFLAMAEYERQAKHLLEQARM
ncbi:uncharacterized protein PV07_04995 [Cladophialophora immunda]|uniref:PEP phosphonomutase n=1 Tax=Cladophialophora immunda TaxID=569365 RepID=A0A0D2D038_9EURO|nr:uncharacterized protein PV07_04995 [Cladophialophora immunda]KIW29159.1 hypothetical protein PV07_04995 [Cladophialophora immunda]OQU96929.1 hypothetical protein CLAIMM_02940 [Cladophialophora immunda]